MKISLNWLKEYVKTDLPVEQITEILTNLGLEVEGIENIENIKGGLQGLVVGEVVECSKHPDADKLSLTSVSIGSEPNLSIVCGAPNVAKGQKVIIATVGATLYPISGEPFKIKKSKIRGADSEGMICAEDEIGLGNSHDGIIVLDSNAVVGQTVIEYLNSIGGYKGKTIENDTLIEIGLTPNRSDATSHIGVAFDLAAYLKVNFPGQGEFNLPKTDRIVSKSNDLPISVQILDHQKCLRYSGVSIKGVKVAESPEWLKNRLTSIGVSPINNIVDISNFVLHELGQPLHTFDYDKISGKGIKVRTLEQGTKFITLDAVERSLRSEDLMICDASSKPLCIAGVFGGQDSGISDETSNIFIESAYFHPKAIRSTSMHHLLRTDAASCFEKGTDPNMTVFALERACSLILSIAGGNISSDLIDIYPNPISRKEVSLKLKNVQKLIGSEINKESILEILDALDMKILGDSGDSLHISIPSNKSDVQREVDVIEEILRVYGYNKIETPNTLQSILSFSSKPDSIILKNRVSEWLSALGFNEILGLSLSRSSYYQHDEEIKDSLVFINNTSNQSLDLMRPSMLMSGLEVILHNQNRQIADLSIFEFGKTYTQDSELKFNEKQQLSMFIAGQRNPESWLNQQKSKVSFYTLKAYVQNIFEKLGIDLQGSSFKHHFIENQGNWAYALEVKRGRDNLATVGMIHPKILFEMDIKSQVFHAVINWDLLLQIVKKQKIQYKPLAKFPSMRRDLALIIPEDIQFHQVLNIAQKNGKSILKEVNLFDVYTNKEHLGEGKKSYAVSFIFQDENKTLVDKDVDNIMENLIQFYERELGAFIRK